MQLRIIHKLILKSFLFLLLSAGFLPAAYSQQKPPLTYSEIVTALNSTLPNKAFQNKMQMIAWLITQIEERGVNKPLTEDRKDILYESGATGLLISAIRNNSPEPSYLVGPRDNTPEHDALLKTTLKDFTEAIEAKDFGPFVRDFHPSFKAQTTVESFTQSFQSYFKNKDVVVPVLRSAGKLEPVYTNGPIEYVLEKKKQDVLEMEGYFKTKPYLIKFKFVFYKENSAWKIFGVQVVLIN